MLLNKLSLNIMASCGTTATLSNKDFSDISFKSCPYTLTSPLYPSSSFVNSLANVDLPYNVKQLLHKIRRYFYRLIYIQNFYFNFFIRSLSVRILICSIAIAFNFSILSVASIPSFIKTAFKFSRFDKHTNCDISA